MQKGWPLVSCESLASAAGEGSQARQHPGDAEGMERTAGSQQSSSREGWGGDQPFQDEAERDAVRKGCWLSQAVS